MIRMLRKFIGGFGVIACACAAEGSQVAPTRAQFAQLVHATGISPQVLAAAGLGPQQSVLSLERVYAEGEVAESTWEAYSEYSTAQEEIRELQIALTDPEMSDIDRAGAEVALTTLLEEMPAKLLALEHEFSFLCADILQGAVTEAAAQIRLRGSTLGTASVPPWLRLAPLTEGEFIAIGMALRVEASCGRAGSPVPSAEASLLSSVRSAPVVSQALGQCASWTDSVQTAIDHWVLGIDE